MKSHRGMTQRLIGSSALLCALLATSCGGGGDSGSGSGGGGATPTVTTPGLWRGRITASNGQFEDTVGIVTEDGQARFITLGDGVQLFGTMPTTGAQVQASLTGALGGGLAFTNGRTVDTFTINATATRRTSLNGSYSGGGGQGTFALTYDNAYERGAALGTIAGVWSRFDSDGYAVSVSVTSNGVLTGSDSLRCVYNGTYSGLGVLADSAAGRTNDALIYQANNNSYVVTGPLFR